MSNENNKLKLYKNEFRFGFYDIPEYFLLQQSPVHFKIGSKDIGGNKVRVFDQGNTFLFGRSIGREFKIETFDFKEQKIDTDDQTDAYIDVSIDYTIAGGHKFDSEEAQAYIDENMPEDEYRSRLIDKNGLPTDELREIENEAKKKSSKKNGRSYKAEMDNIIKSRNSAYRREWWQTHHPIYKYLQAEKTIKKEQKDNGSGTKGIMENTIMEVVRSYLVKKPFELIQLISDANTSISVEDNSEMGTFGTDNNIIEYFHKVNRENLDMNNEIREKIAAIEADNKMSDEAKKENIDLLKQLIRSIYTEEQIASFVEDFKKLKQNMAKDITRELAQKGLAVQKIHIANVKLDPSINELYNEIRKAKLAKEKAIIEAMTEKQATIIKSEGDAQAILNKGEAENQVVTELAEKMEGRSAAEINAMKNGNGRYIVADATLANMVADLKSHIQTKQAPAPAEDMFDEKVEAPVVDEQAPEIFTEQVGINEPNVNDSLLKKFNVNVVAPDLKPAVEEEVAYDPNNMGNYQFDGDVIVTETEVPAEEINEGGKQKKL